MRARFTLLLLELEGKAANIQFIDEEVGAAALEAAGARCLLCRRPQQPAAGVLQCE